MRKYIMYWVWVFLFVMWILHTAKWEQPIYWNVLEVIVWLWLILIYLPNNNK